MQLNSLFKDQIPPKPDNDPCKPQVFVRNVERSIFFPGLISNEDAFSHGTEDRSIQQTIFILTEYIQQTQELIARDTLPTRDPHAPHPYRLG